MNLGVLFDKDECLEYQNILIRPARDSDYKALYSIYGDKRTYLFRPGLLRENERAVKKLVSRMRREESDRKQWFRIVCRGDNPDAIVGVVEIYNINQRIEEVEIGYTISPDLYGKGIATEVVNLVTRFLFDEVKCNRIKAMVHINNTASQKVLQKNGYTKEGVERQGEFWQGIGFVDVCRFAKLREDYIGGKDNG